MNYQFEITALERAFADLVAAYPDLAEDDELRADVFEGETDADRILSRLLSEEREANALSGAAAERIKDLQARKARFDRKKEAMRSLMLRLMQAGGLSKRQLPEGTVSVSKGRDKVEITDEAALPRWAYETVRKPDKKAILERLAANKNVKGAALVTGEPTLSVRAV